VWKRRKVPDPPVSPEGQATRDTTTVSFSEHRRRCGTVGSSNARNTPPFSSLRVLSYRFPSESVLGSIQSGVSGVSGFCVPRFGSRFPLKLPSGYPVPKYHGPQGSLACWPSAPLAGFPQVLSPKFQGTARPPNPIQSGGFSPLSQRPLRGGGIMANFRSHVLNMAGTRLVPTHSLAFRPECYSRVLHPTQTYRPLPRQVGGQGGSAAPRGHPPSGALQHAVPYTQKGAEPRREASRIKPTLSVRSHAAPTGISSGRIGTRTAARVRPRCGRT
jgi:hypothetical protein